MSLGTSGTASGGAGAPCGLAAPPRRPLESMPARRRGSVRRTMHVDVGARTEWGVALPMAGGARDLRTGGPRGHVVLAEASVRAGFDPERRLVELDARPASTWVDSLLGTPAGGGFRRRLAEIVPPREAGSLLRQVLDDLPAALLISGYAFMRLARRQGLTPSSLTPPNVLDRMVDLCSGWRAGGVAAASIGTGNGVPMQDTPPAPVLLGRTLPAEEPGLHGDEAGSDPGSDAHAWHDIGPLPQDHMRRRRCLDVKREDDGSFALWAMFRDTVGEDDEGSESVLHEYEVSALLTPAGTVTAIAARPRVLPFPECPAAADHVERLIGTSVADLPAAVPDLIAGTASCTHLNDLLRAFGGVAELLPAISSD